MATLRYLAAAYRLEAEHQDGITTYVHTRSDPSTGRRKVRHEERWCRQRNPLGWGASGIIWLEERVDNSKELRAVKSVSKSVDSSTTVDPRDEAVVMSILSQPKNAELFVSFHGWFETSDSFHLVMSYMELGDLSQYLLKHERLPEDEASSIIGQLLEGLEVIHHAGVIHRDLKPGNGLTQRLSPWWVKISDFGIARRMEDLSAITSTGAGTSGYLAPEVSLQHRTRHTNAVDLWSLGCVVHELLTKKIPFLSSRDTGAFCNDPSVFHKKLDAREDMSDEAKVFVKTLIVAEPGARATVRMAAKSTWITKHSNPETTGDLPHPSSSTLNITTNVSISTDAMSSAVSEQESALKRSGTQVSLSPRASTTSSQVTAGKKDMRSYGITAKEKSTARKKVRRYEADPVKGLFYSVGISDPAAVWAFLDAGVDKESKDDGGCTSLYRAAQKGDKEVVQLLLDADADKETKDNKGCTPLYKAAQNGHEEIVRLLLDADADTELAYGSIERTSPLFTAAENGHEKVVQLLLKAGADKEARSDTGLTPLHMAANRGHEKVVRLLLDAGADKEAKAAEEWTPLYIAIGNGHEKVVQLLLKAGADKEAKTARGSTPLSIAVSSGHEGVVQLLLNAGADKEAKPADGLTPLHVAAGVGYEKVVQLLLDAGADKEAKSDKGLTPLHVAVGNGHEKVVQLLLKAGADKEAKHAIGWTPLHVAAGVGYEKVVQLLLDAGANLSTRNTDGDTPIMIARKKGHDQVVELFERHTRELEQREKQSGKERRRFM